jgi:hypothetical protein
MKDILKYYFFIAVTALLAALASACSESGEQSEKEIVLKKLTSKTWILNSVTIDGVDKSNAFAGLTITFTATGLTVGNGNVIWPQESTWSFTDDTASAFIRSNDQVTVKILELTESMLKLELTWNTATFGPGGRPESVSGKYVFVFE